MVGLAQHVTAMTPEAGSQPSMQHEGQAGSGALSATMHTKRYSGGDVAAAVNDIADEDEDGEEDEEEEDDDLSPRHASTSGAATTTSSRGGTTKGGSSLKAHHSKHMKVTGPATNGRSEVELAMLDPKRVRRILANRQSAAKSKERRLAYTQELTTKMEALQAEGQALQANTQQLAADNKELGEHVALLQKEVAATQAKLAKLRASNSVMSKEILHAQKVLGLPQHLPEPVPAGQVQGATSSADAPIPASPALRVQHGQEPTLLLMPHTTAAASSVLMRLQGDVGAGSQLPVVIQSGELAGGLAGVALQGAGVSALQVTTATTTTTAVATGSVGQQQQLVAGGFQQVVLPVQRIEAQQQAQGSQAIAKHGSGLQLSNSSMYALPVSTTHQQAPALPPGTQPARPHQLHVPAPGLSYQQQVIPGHNVISTGVPGPGPVGMPQQQPRTQLQGSAPSLVDQFVEWAEAGAAPGGSSPVTGLLQQDWSDVPALAAMQGGGLLEPGQ